MRLIDGDALQETIKQQLCVCDDPSRMDCIVCSVGDCLMFIDEAPTIEAEPVKHGRWVIREKDKLVPTGKIAVSEGHILHKTSLDEPFTLQSANIIQIKKHRTVKIPYCSICRNYGDDEYDKTPYCPYCGAKMDGEAE